MQYYEYLNIDDTNYQNKVHNSKSGNCVFNVGIEADGPGDQIDVLLEVSIDGVLWAENNTYRFSNQRLTNFIDGLYGYKSIRIRPLDDETICNMYVSEYYKSISLMAIGG